MENRKQHTRACGLCRKNVQWPHGSKPTICPHCDAIKWDKPRDECYLFNVQEQYRQTKDQKYLGQIYERCMIYGTRVANKALSGMVNMDSEVLQDKVQDAVTTFISYYLRRDDYHITESFGYQILKAVQQQLYRKKQQDVDKNEMSYDAPFSEGEDKTFKDKISEDHDDGNKYDNENLEKMNKVFIIEELSNFIDKVYMAIAENRGIDHAILSMVLLHHYLQKKKDLYFDNFYTYFGYDLKESFELEKLVLLEFLEEMQE